MTVWQLSAADRLFATAEPRSTLAIAGPPARLRADDVVGCLPAALRPAWPGIVDRLTPGDERAELALSLGDDHETSVRVAALPAAASRHDAPARPDELAALIRDLDRPPRGPVRLLVACNRGDDAVAHAIAATRALPRYRRKTGDAGERAVTVAFASPDALPPAASLELLRDAIADAIEWHEMPCAELGVDALVDLARDRAAAVGAEIEVVRGDELARAGLGGLYAVGRAAAAPPALVVLRHRPGNDEAPRPCWVGKGVVFDSGGLNLKRPAEMRGMKGDMAGAGAALAAFSAAATLGGPGVDAVLCIAENTVGPLALRPDDIVTMHAGKTVEITDTDSEGRLLLADGVSYAVRHLRPDVVVDLATLTDSAVIATGRTHAAIVTNDASLEAAAVEAGRQTGDLVHPLPHLPAVARRALASEVADLRNAPLAEIAGASVAAQLIAEHLGDHRGGWLHVDLEGPSRTETGRGTGFGVGLLLRCFAYL